MGYTLWLCQQFAIENGPVKIVDFPINSMVIVHSYVSLPEGNQPHLFVKESIQWYPHTLQKLLQ